MFRLRDSFQFYNYILQSRERIRQLEGDYFLIIGDDLLLNPRFDEFFNAVPAGNPWGGYVLP